MKWITKINQPASEKDSFELWDEQTLLAEFSMNAKTQVGRMVSNLTRRIFQMEKRGILKRRTVIRNEYGVRLGHIKIEEEHPMQGFVFFEGKKYRFNLQDENQTSRLLLFDEDAGQRIYTCDLGRRVIKSEKGLHVVKLLAASCMYFLLPASYR